MTSDVVVIGGGVIGLSMALELARRCVRVTVLDRIQPGNEASWAGAGMLPPGNPAVNTGVEQQLRAYSHVLWPEWHARLLEATGIDNEFHRGGSITLRFAAGPNSLDNEVQQWRREGVAVEKLSPLDVRGIEPAVTCESAAAYVLPEFGQVRNPRHLQALQAACVRAGVTIRSNSAACEFEFRGGKVVAVRCSGAGGCDAFSAGQFVIASGAFSSTVLCQLGVFIPVQPVRGQMLLLHSRPGLLQRVIGLGSQYIVPRRDGRVLVGATEEAAGFDKRNTPRGVQNLMTLAESLVPQLADATFERAWAGLRPRGVDTLPYIGWAGEHRNVLVATGHFRAGLQLSPITAVIGTAMLLGDRPPVDPAPFRIDRLPHDASPLHGVVSEPLSAHEPPLTETATQGHLA